MSRDAEPHVIDVANALLGEHYDPAGPTRLTINNGRLTDLQPLEHMPEGPRRLALPALTDAHNHARPLSTTSFGAGLRPLETWLPRLTLMPAVDPYLAACAAFGRSARGGCCAVMVHLTRPMGLCSLVDEARAIAQAAHDTGVSIALAINLRDRNPLVYGDHQALLSSLSPEARQFVEQTWHRPAMDIDDQLDQIDAVADGLKEWPSHVDVQYGPAGVQWCSEQLLEAIAERSASNGRRVHMHLLETQAQRVWADRYFSDRHEAEQSADANDGMLAWLETIGLLTPRLTVAHGVWARPAELARLARCGTRIAVNPSSNLHLASGIASAAAMHQAGIAVGLGLDGCALDEDDDGLRELRLFRLLNAGWGFNEGLTPALALRCACANGRASLGLPGRGTLDIGEPADIMILDLDALDRDALMPVDPLQYLFARATAGMIVELLAGGRRIVVDGEVCGIDLAETETALRSRYRDLLAVGAGDDTLRHEVEALLGEHFTAWCGCGEGQQL